MVAHRSSIDFKARKPARRVGDGSRHPVDKCRRSDSAVAPIFLDHEHGECSGGF
jgi:hypothetical protein